MRFLTDKNYDRAARFIMGFLVLVVLFTFRDYGISWDEEIQSQYGQAVVDYYMSGFVDYRFAQIFNLHLYGGMFDGLAAVLAENSPLGMYPTRHLLNAIFGLLGLWGTWRLGRVLGGNSVGLISLVLLALTPMYYGHMFNNPKDIPFAAGVVWSLYYMYKTLSIVPQKVPTKLIVTLGLVLGLTLGVRVGGVMIFGFWCIVLMFQQRKNAAQTILHLILPVGLIAYVVMLICWPWAQQNPILNPLKALGEFSNFPQDVEVLLDGVIYRSTQLPWTYLPVYFGAQLPPLLIVLIVAGFMWMPFLWTELSRRQGKQASLALLLLTICVPLIYALLHRPALYDAVRHFLFTIPLMCVISAMAARQVLTWVRPWKWCLPLLAVALTFAASMQVNTMSKLHPYEYIYINSLQGGVSGAVGHYELDYWGSSFKEAAEKLDEYVTKEGGVPPGKIYQIAICGPWSSAMIYLPPYYEAVVANEEADFFLSTTRWGCQNMRPGREIIRIERLGAPLSIVKDLRGLPLLSGER
ncbi:MAG: glycosyltransferase family 39 protein [Alphaproteobacteria bacterium]|nr:glycosyltransferase family 39 protein [Alphaproteobacteria bacterium]